MGRLVVLGLVPLLAPALYAAAHRLRSGWVDNRTPPAFEPFARVDAICFFIGAISLPPYLLFAVWEHQMFSRVPVVLVTLAFVGVLLFWCEGGRAWLEDQRTFWTKLTLLTMFCLILGAASLLILLYVSLVYVVLRLAIWLLGLRRISRRYWSVGYQVSAIALTIFVLFPAMNTTHFIRGVFRHIDPYVVQENWLYGTNIAGYRGPLVPSEKPASTTRLLFLGDSITFGFPYRYEEAYPSRVGDELEASAGGKVDIINAGVIGQSLIQTHRNLDQYLATDPDVVFVMHGMHYMKSLANRRRDEWFTGDRYDHRFEYQPVPPFLKEIFYNAMTQTSLYAAATFSTAERDESRNLALFRQALEDLITRVTASGARLVLLEYPSRHLPRANAAIREISARRGVRFVPLLDLIDAYAFGDDVHPDRQGHRKIAHAIASRMISDPGLPRD